MKNQLSVKEYAHTAQTVELINKRFDAFCQKEAEETGIPAHIVRKLVKVEGARK